MSLMRKTMIGLAALVLSATIACGYLENIEPSSKKVIHKECCILIQRRR